MGTVQAACHPQAGTVHPLLPLVLLQCSSGLFLGQQRGREGWVGSEELIWQRAGSGLGGCVRARCAVEGFPLLPCCAQQAGSLC